MLTAHQLIQLRRAGFRVEDNDDGIFTAILDHPTAAQAFEWRLGERSPLLRNDLEPIILPFLAFRAARRKQLDVVEAEIVVRTEWYVYSCSTEPNASSISFAPQLDARGQKALAFLKAFVAGLEPGPC